MPLSRGSSCASHRIIARKHSNSGANPCSRFIEWGLAHPDQIDWIPRHPVGLGGFSERVKSVFWGIVWNRKDLPD
jgi:hypothetical protein